MLSDEEKNSMELDIEAKYVGRTEKEFLNNITYAECLYILDTKNKYCDDKCSICKNYITISDIQNNNFELSITKRKTKVYAHKTCIERSSKNGTRNRR